MAIGLEHANLPYIYTPSLSPPHALRGDPHLSTAAELRAPGPSAGIASAIMIPRGGFRDGEAPQKGRSKETGPQGAADNRRIRGQRDSADLRGTTTESHQGDRGEMGQATPPERAVTGGVRERMDQGAAGQSGSRTGAAAPEPIVSLRGVSKSFPGVLAVQDASLDILPGEVHALVGENGAGKSTLMKVLAGVYRKDAGRVLYKGKEVEIPTPRAAQQLGISIIHQDLSLMPHLTVAQNVFIGRERGGLFNLLVNDRAIERRTQQLLALLHLKMDPRTKVSSLTVAAQQLVEITRVLSFHSEVLIMDEPTAARAEAEIEELFHIIRQLGEKGVGIVYISHRLHELKQISDRITVMRDGRTIETVPTREASIDQVIRMMVGREIFQASPQVLEREAPEVVLEVRNLRR